MWNIKDVGGVFQEIFQGFAGFVPDLVAAVILFILGWIVSIALSKVVEQVVKSLRIDKLLDSAGAGAVLSRGGLKLNSGKFLGELVKWFVIVASLVAAFNALGLDQVNNFLQRVVIDYIPQVIAAVLILVIAVILAEFMRKLVTNSAKAANVASANFLGSVTKWAIWVFAILTALAQLGIASRIIEVLISGVITAVALAVGLAFGLGGQDTAASILDKVRKDISDR